MKARETKQCLQYHFRLFYLFMFSKLPNQPEPSQILDSVNLTTRLTSNGFDTAQHTV